MIPVCNMATKDHHILNVQEDISKQATTSSGLKVVESESELRRKSLPSIAPLNFEVGSAMEAPRSCDLAHSLLSMYLRGSRPVGCPCDARARALLTPRAAVVRRPTSAYPAG